MQLKCLRGNRIIYRFILKIGKLYSSVYIDIPKAFFTLRQVGRSLHWCDPR